MAQLLEGSIIQKSTGNEVIATLEDVPENISDLNDDVGITKITLGTVQPTSGWWFEEIV